MTPPKNGGVNQDEDLQLIYIAAFMAIFTFTLLCAVSFVPIPPIP